MGEGFDLGSIVAHIKADTAQFTAGLEEAKGQADGFASHLANIAAIGAGVADALVVAFGVKSVKAFSESEDLIAQTNAVLRSTAGVAGVTAEEVTKLSKAWEAQTKYSDEAVRGAENVLLTFTKIGKDKFPEATAAVLDMSTALHEDLQSASIQVGKALQDPILGVTALRRVGVNFNEAAKETIKHLMDIGDQAGAQAFILKELNTEFGGSAKAAGETFSGAMAKLSNRFNDFEEIVGGKIIKSLMELQTWYDNNRRVINDVAGVVGTFVGVLGTLLFLYGNWILLTKALTLVQTLLNLVFVANPIVGAITAIIIVAALVVEHWTAVKDFFIKMWDDIKKHWLEAAVLMVVAFGPIGVAIDALVFAADEIITHWEGVKQFFIKMFDEIKDHIVVAGIAIAIALGPVGVMIDSLALGADELIKHWDAVKNFFLRLNRDITQWFDDAQSRITKLPGQIINAFQSIPGELDRVWQHVWSDITQWWNNITGFFSGVWKDIINYFKQGLVKILEQFLEFDLKSVERWYHALDHWWQAIDKWFRTIPEKLWQDFDKHIWQTTLRWIESVPDRLYRQLDSWWQAFDRWIKSLPGKIASQLDLWWQEILKWMESIPGKIEAQLVKWWQALDSWFRNLPKQLADSLTQSGNDMAQRHTQSFAAVWKDGKKITEIALIVLAALLAIPVIIAVTVSVEFINFGIKIIGWIIQGLTAAIGGLLHLVGQIGGKVIGAIGDAGGWLYQIGKDIIGGLIHGIQDAIGGIGHAIGKVGSDVGKSVSSALHAIHVPGFAAGVHNFAGGLAVVGEKGPELVNLPSGSDVIPNGQIQGVNGVTTNIGTINIANEVDATSFLNKLTRNQEFAKKGLTPVR